MKLNLHKAINLDKILIICIRYTLKRTHRSWNCSCSSKTLRAHQKLKKKKYLICK